MVIPKNLIRCRLCDCTVPKEWKGQEYCRSCYDLQDEAEEDVNYLKVKYGPAKKED